MTDLIWIFKCDNVCSKFSEFFSTGLLQNGNMTYFTFDKKNISELKNKIYVLTKKMLQSFHCNPRIYSQNELPEYLIGMEFNFSQVSPLVIIF